MQYSCSYRSLKPSQLHHNKPLADKKRKELRPTRISRQIPVIEPRTQQEKQVILEAVTLIIQLLCFQKLPIKTDSPQLDLPPRNKSKATP